MASIFHVGFDRGQEHFGSTIAKPRQRSLRRARKTGETERQIALYYSRITHGWIENSSSRPALLPA